MKEVDRDKDGYINLNVFKAEVGWEDDDNMNEMRAFNNMALLPPMPSDNMMDKSVASIKVKKLTKFEKLWTVREG